MIRPMTSNVSALSGIVANGHQAIHFVSSAGVTPDAHLGYYWMVHRQLPSPDFHRLDWQPYGLRAKNTEKSASAMRSVRPFAAIFVMHPGDSSVVCQKPHSEFRRANAA